MFENDSGINNSPGSNNAHDVNYSASDYRTAADNALKQGEKALAAHLYIASFERSPSTPNLPDASAVEALRQAWSLACELKERSLAEYVFERLEPCLAHDEIAHYAEELQQLALDKLEEFGLSRDDLQEMADTVSAEFSGLHGAIPLSPELLLRGGDTRKFDGGLPSTRESSPSSHADDTKVSVPEAQDAADAASADKNEHRYSYGDLIGYDCAINAMRNQGFGVGDDAEFKEFLSMLSRRHGIDRPMAGETLLFRSLAREDANRFMTATVGELGVPALRMCMEENPQGMPVLCVMSSSDYKSRIRLGNDAFTGAGALLLEDIDLWGAPWSATDDFDLAPFAQLSRGARDAINLIHAAVANPEVTVMATCSTEHPFDDFFTDILEPICVIDIDTPTAAEREAIWAHCSGLYPSLRFLDRAELVRMSTGMSRCDIYYAARESVEQAYAESVRDHSFVSVARDNIFNKIAAYQPLESKEYREIEDAAVESLRRDIQGIEDDLRGSED